YPGLFRGKAPPEPRRSAPRLCILLIDTRRAWQLAGAQTAAARQSPGRSRPRGRCDAGKQDGENPGEENPVERAGAADRSDGGAKTADLVEVEKVGADQRSHRATDIGKRRGIFARQDKSEN